MERKPRCSDAPCHPVQAVVALRTAIPPNTDETGVAVSRQLGGRLPVAQVGPEEWCMRV